MEALTMAVHYKNEHIYRRANVSSVQGKMDTSMIFKFSELRQIYESHLHDLGIRKETNKVRFKDQVLDYFKRSVECSDYQDDALTLMKAAKLCEMPLLG